MTQTSVKRTIAAAIAFSLLVPAAVVAMPGSAEARSKRNHEYKEWRGRDGRTYCRKSDGTTGLVVGAAGGALLGRTIDTRGDRTLGTVAGAVAGGLIGKKIDSGKKCR
ncbi:MAG: glycine zipper 2TM domain-containing protein [Sphingobium sp.]|nr:glycine zipper 2TM domain-containing protein [Sphingobium sp.]